MKPLLYSRSLTLALLLGSLALSGCTSITSMSGIANPVDHPLVTGGAVKGYVFGGHAPVVGAHVYLLQPGTSGIGSRATSQLNAVTPGATANVNDPGVPVGAYYVTTDSSGAFTVANGGYSCLTNSSSTTSNVPTDYPAIIYAYGGTSVMGEPSNTAIVQLATLGSCAGLGSLPYIYLNEVSTVATAYAFQGFTPAVPTATTNYATYIGTHNTVQGITGIVNASNTAGELYSIDGHYETTGTPVGEGHIANPYTSNGNGIVPQVEIDTLANVLSNCVDTSATNAACTDLFTLATSDGTTTGSKAKDTATAMIDIARHPAGVGSIQTVTPDNFVQRIYNLQQAASEPYTPYLTTDTGLNDFTLAIQYPVSSTTYPLASNSYVGAAESVAVDGSGYIWMTGQANKATWQWDSQGVLNGSSEFQNTYIYGYVSIDQNNNAWAGNAASTSGIQEFGPNGQQTQTFGDKFTQAYTVITDNTGDVFFGASTANNPNTNGAQDLVEYTAADIVAGTGSTPTYSNLSSISNANSVIVSHGAIDAYGDLWLTAEGTIPNGAHSSTNPNGEYSSTNQAITRVTKAGATVEGTCTGNFFGVPYTYACATFPLAAPTVPTPFHTAVNQPQPEYPAINSAGDAIIPIQSTYSPTGTTANFVPGVYVVSPDGTAVTQLYSGTCTGRNCNGNSTNGNTAYSSVYTGANFYQSFGAAVDGNGNIWITNRYNAGLGGSNTAGNGNSTLIELNGTNYSAISPPTNYIPTNGATPTPIMNDALNLAIDPSGNIWITNYTGNQVVEVIGAAAPVVTPLSVAAGTNTFGTTP